MVFPNFFITFVRHSFHTSPPLHTPSRERRHRPAPPATRHHTPLMAHALPRYAHATLSRAAPRKGAMLTRHAHATHPRPSQHPPHTTTPRKGLCHTRCSLSQHTRPPHYNPRKGLCHTRCSPSQHTRPPPPRKGLCHAHAHAQKCRNAFPCPPSFLRRKSEPPQPKYYILQYYM